MLASVVVSLAGSTLAAPTAAAKPAAVVKGTTTFTASRNAVATVRVPRAASLDLDVSSASTPNAEVYGRGRIVGFVLSAVRQPASGDDAVLFVTKVGACGTPGCEPTAPYYSVEYSDGGDGLPTRDITPTRERITLPAGDYYVRSITDGSPVRMTLRLAGLTGSTAIPVTTPNRIVLRTDTSPPGTLGVDPLRSAGPVTYESDPRGYSQLIYVILRDYQPHVRSLTGVCFYRNHPDPPTLGRYHAGCPNAFYEDMTNAGAPALRHYGMTVSGVTFITPGTWTVGYYSNGVGGQSTLSAVSLWMDLI